MRDKCFDEGMIQAFFDGELESNLLEQVARHVSSCDPCAVLMSEIEAESASVASAFEIENFELVPTERLRTKIFAEIAEFETGGSSWLSKVAAALGFPNGFRWTSPTVAAFASLVLVAGVVVGLLNVRTTERDTPLAGVTTVQNKPVQQALPSEPVTSAPLTQASTRAQDESVVARKAVYVEQKPRIDIAPVTNGEAQPLQDEERYLRTIKTLKHSMDVRKEDSLKPSALASYERDMAVIDAAIDKMQRAARKNPKDEAAKQVLLASYQNKIDLLSSVSDKTELMASLR